MNRTPTPAPNLALADAMLSAGVSGRDLAARARVNPVTVSRLVNGHNAPRPVTAARVAAALGTTPAALGWKGGVR